MLAQFDDDFPFESAIDDAQKPAKIVEIIKLCFENANAYKDGWIADESAACIADNSGISIPEINGAFFTLTKSDKKESDDKLKNQMNIIYRNGLKTEKTILKCIAVGHKNDISYINYLADMYSKDVAEGNKVAKNHKYWNKIQIPSEIQ